MKSRLLQLVVILIATILGVLTWSAVAGSDDSGSSTHSSNSEYVPAAP